MATNYRKLKLVPGGAGLAEWLVNMDGVNPVTLFLENFSLKSELQMRTGGDDAGDNTPATREIAYVTQPGGKNSCVKFAADAGGPTGDASATKAQVFLPADQTFSDETTDFQDVGANDVPMPDNAAVDATEAHMRLETTQAFVDESADFGDAGANDVVFPANTQDATEAHMRLETTQAFVDESADFGDADMDDVSFPANTQDATEAHMFRNPTQAFTDESVGFGDADADDVPFPDATQPASEVWVWDETAGTFADDTADFVDAGTDDVELPHTSASAAGDFIAFGLLGKFTSLTIVAGILGTVGTVAWEYWSGSAWTALVVVDGTVGFTIAGTQTVTWTAPVDWATTTIETGAESYFVRARVVTPYTVIPELTSGTVGGADVSSYLAIGFTGKFRKITLTTSTPGVGGTVAWEYWNGSAWAAIPGVVDASVGFTLSPQTVTFDAPADWAKTTVNSVTSLYYVRARVVTTYATTPLVQEGTLGGVDLDSYLAIGFTGKFRTITLTTSTLGVGGAVAWEFWNGASWLAIPGVADTSAGFTASPGVVTFAVPPTWAKTAVNTVTQLYYVRARITTTYTTTPLVQEGTLGGVDIDSYLAIGFTGKFRKITLTTSTLGVAGVVAWEYWNGSAWAAIPGVVDGSASFTVSPGDVTFAAPADWATTTVNGGAALYYVRARITTTYTTTPLVQEGTLGDTDVEGYIAIGYTSQFSLLNIITGTLGTVGGVTWEYWNGSAWTVIPGVADTSVGFTVSPGEVTFVAPVDWVKNSVNGSVALYHVRARIATAYTVSAILSQGNIGGALGGNATTIEMTAAVDQEYSIVSTVVGDWTINLACDSEGNPTMTPNSLIAEIEADASADAVSFKNAVDLGLAPGSDGSARFMLYPGSTTHVIPAQDLAGGTLATVLGDAKVYLSANEIESGGPYIENAAAGALLSAVGIDAAKMASGNDPTILFGSAKGLKVTAAAAADSWASLAVTG